ncbi:rod-binding protein [Paenirhodobacter populi]
MTSDFCRSADHDPGRITDSLPPAIILGKISTMGCPMINDISGGFRPLPEATSRGRAEELKEKAVQLEANFLSEMLGYAGFSALQGEFGGGIGEEQFTSFLRDSYAQTMAETGGIGLAETIYHALTKGADNA